MASNSDFTDQLPSNTSSAALGDDEFRSTKSFMRNWWEEDHYALDGSSGSAGVHKLGSARGFEMAATSELSNPTGDNSGKLAWVSANNGLYVADGSNSTWTLVTNSITLGSNQTWTARQGFTRGVTIGDLTGPPTIHSIQTFSVDFPAGMSPVPAGGSLNSLVASGTTLGSSFGVVLVTGPVQPGSMSDAEWNGLSFTVNNTATLGQFEVRVSNHTDTDASYTGTLTVSAMYFRVEA